MGVGDAATSAELATKAGRYYADGSRWGLFEDTIPVLHQLRADGWRHAVFSNNVPELETNLGLLGMGDVVGAERAGIPAILVRREHPQAQRQANDLVEAAVITTSSRNA